MTTMTTMTHETTEPAAQVGDGDVRVLLLESIHPDGAANLRDQGYQVETVAGALDEATLIERVKGVHLLGIRSGTNVTEAVLEAADSLLAVGAFCIGTNQIDLEAAAARGVAVARCGAAAWAGTGGGARCRRARPRAGQ